MKKFLFFLVKIVICFSVVFPLIVSFLLLCPYKVYDNSYQAVIQKKYDYLKDIEGQKIIIVGGSNASFGIDEEKIEAETGYKVANLGLHAGFGAIVPSELSKANIAEGDIVILAYEWGWHTPGYFDLFGTDLVISGFEHRLDMYKYLPSKHYPKLIGYLGENFKKKLNYIPASGVYSAESFDAIGRMTLDRPEAKMKYEGNEASLGCVNLGGGIISEDCVQYLKEYKAFIEERGASVYFVAPPVYSGAVVSTPEVFEKLIQQLEERIGIPYISEPESYFFPKEFIFDTPYHCTNLGEERRTELLILDLKKIL